MAVDAISLAVFRSLFEAVAEEMGVTLQRAAFSPNIRERLDFSCAIFDARARMIAQAAHIPVHLGSMPASVEAAVRAFRTLQPRRRDRPERSLCWRDASARRDDGLAGVHRRQSALLRRQPRASRRRGRHVAGIAAAEHRTVSRRADPAAGQAGRSGAAQRDGDQADHRQQPRARGTAGRHRGAVGGAARRRAAAAGNGRCQRLDRDAATRRRFARLLAADDRGDHRVDPRRHVHVRGCARRRRSARIHASRSARRSPWRGR